MPSGINGMVLDTTQPPDPTYAPCRNSGATALLEGQPVQWDMTSKDGKTVKAAATSGLLTYFAGVLRQGLAATDGGDNAQAAAGLVTEGICKCRFKNHASATAGTWATPVNGQTYLTYSATPTGIYLLTDQSNGTDVHTPDEGAHSPKVWILPPRYQIWAIQADLDTAEAAELSGTLQAAVADVSSASTGYIVAPEALTVTGGYIVVSGAVTVANAVVTVSDLADAAALTLTVVHGTSGAGVKYTGVLGTAGNRTFTAGEVIKIACDGGSTDAASGQVILTYTKTV